MKMKLKIGLCSLVFAAVLICQIQSAMACTIFSVSLEDGTVLACNNEDWMYSIENTVKISAPDSNSYGRVCFYNLSYVQGGMNEYGLFYDGASCPSTEVPYDKEKDDLGYDLGEIALAKCKTVKEVEEFFNNHNIPKGFYDHLLFADPTGNVAVFEWVENKFQVIWKEPEKSHQVITNFWLSDPALGGYPCTRYDTADQALSSEKPSFELCEKILNKTKQDWGDGGTLYSNICNLNTREVFLYYRCDTHQSYQINLIDELKSMDSGSCKSMDMQVICSGQDIEVVRNEKAPDAKDEERKPVEEEVPSTDPEKTDSKKTAFEVITAILVIIIIITFIVKKHDKK
ncbi:hypothetical protein H0486_04910 [Lachnospiraceae bacterium MD1]|uniref:C-type lectin domain-containing protein n=1 Tax=Variimorphobacter saccharofermentans TaxID=2755051 RepID=A0A839JY18_9FIRM|nr:hypothetical protein [Variimorphobacter saccharofermentans]MBB2182214.1 hypothetical protein [Variimorphobacter saccharofermentans]